MFCFIETKMNPYEVLGISTNASKDDIKKAYRKLALQHHPDRGGDESKFKELTQAHSILTDDEKRKRYDMTGSIEDGPNAFNFRGFNPFDMFGGMFRHPERQPPTKLPPKVVTYEISLEDMWKGTEIKFRIKLEKQCICNKSCEMCKGTGQIAHVQSLGPFQHMTQVPCKYCLATGTIMVGCSNCNNGVCKEEHHCVVNLPARCYDGFQKMFPGWGDQPKRSNEQAGDLIIQVKTKDHPSFTRDHHHLIYHCILSLEDSLVGPEMIIPLFDEQIVVRLSDWGVIDPRKRYVLLEKGMNDENGKRGNLMIQFAIEYPSLTEDVRLRLRDLFQTINRITKK
jgi:molecular chaperone DnaJ